MPAPENLTTQTPGKPTKPATDTPPAPAFTAKHKGGGRWAVVNADGEWVGDFIGTQEEAGVEAQRLIDGGVPYVKPDDDDTPPAPAVSEPAAKATADIDPTTLKQAVLTPEGWLVPAPKEA